MYGSQAWVDWLPYIRVFQMSTIPRVFGLKLWNLAVTNFDMLFLVIGLISLVFLFVCTAIEVLLAAPDATQSTEDDCCP